MRRVVVLECPIKRVNMSQAKLNQTVSGLEITTAAWYLDTDFFSSLHCCYRPGSVIFQLVSE